MLAYAHTLQTMTHAPGLAGSKKPLNTGRADYFGVLANVAARVMGLASPGQVGWAGLGCGEARPRLKQGWMGPALSRCSGGCVL